MLGANAMNQLCMGLYCRKGTAGLCTNITIWMQCILSSFNRFMHEFVEKVYKAKCTATLQE